MQPIRVPKPSPQAFHKNRRISDLLLWQIAHFQHVAEKKSLKVSRKVARDVHTEGGAARFIATVTRALRKDAPSEAANVAPMVRGRNSADAKAKIPAAGTVRRIAATAVKSKPGRLRKNARTERATTGKAKKAKSRADAGTKKRSNAGTKHAGKAKPKAGSKTAARKKPRKS